MDGHVLQYLTSFIFLYPIWLVFTPLLTFVQVILTVELPMGHNVVMSSLVFFLRQTDSPLLYDLLFQPFQGHPTTVFCKICLRRSKYCLEFSFAWGRLKNYRWTFYSICTIFKAYLIKFNFSYFTTQLTLFFLEKGNLKFSDSKMWRREESEKFSLRKKYKTLNCT